MVNTTLWHWMQAFLALANAGKRLLGIGAFTALSSHIAKRFSPSNSSTMPPFAVIALIPEFRKAARQYRDTSPTGSNHSFPVTELLIASS
jgi:hypothetical protein